MERRTGELSIFDCIDARATVTKTITFDGAPLTSGEAQNREVHLQLLLSRYIFCK